MWVATSILRRISVIARSSCQVRRAALKCGENTKLLRFLLFLQHSLNVRKIDDTRQVETEHDRIKNSVLEFFTLFENTLLFSSIT